MIIYIVTSGSYSGYKIDEIFESEEKAQQYVDLYNKTSSYREYRIETKETHDNSFILDEISTQDYLSIDYSDVNFMGKEELKIESRTEIIDDKTKENADEFKLSNYYRHYDYGNGEERNEIGLEIPVSKNLEITQEIRDSYLKVCRDYIAKAKNLHEIEGYSYLEIEKIMFV